MNLSKTLKSFIPERTINKCENTSGMISGRTYSNLTAASNKSSLLSFNALLEEDLHVQCFKQTSVKCTRFDRSVAGKWQFSSTDSEANSTTLEIRGK